MNAPLTLSILSALLLSLPWLGCSGYWALIAWIPLLRLHTSLKEQGKRGFLWWASLTIVVWYTITCYWVANATLLSIPAILIVGWVIFFPSWALFHFVDKRNKKALSFTVLVTAWIVCEWWFTVGDVSFPWIQLGSAFMNDPIAVQWYSILGSYGGTLWILVTNILIYNALGCKKYRPYALVCVILPLLLSVGIYFSYEEQGKEKIEVAVIQPNIDAYQKFSTISARAQTDNLIEIASKATPTTTLFIAPETAIVEYVNELNIAQNEDIRKIQQFLKQSYPNATFLVGASSFDRKGHYNSALYIDTTSVTIYHKGKLVIGVEVVPQWVMLFVETIDMGGYVGSLGKGVERTVVDIDKTKVGAAICYESIYGEYFSEWAKNGAQLLTIITNDGWWGDTPGYRQHFAFARLRAIENRRAIARSANTGISGVINSRGDVLERIDWETRGLINREITLNKELTPYTRWGDVVVRLAMLTLALSLLYALSMHYKRKDRLS